ncbi:MAG TPA: hypothetical protein VFI31_04670, partial [Pirellulales bacterium]|nr:hypothetical protein [Pirellulales bacterium]
MKSYETKIGGRSSRRGKMAKYKARRPAFLRWCEHLEDRLLLTVIGPFDDSPAHISLGDVKAGQTVSLIVDFTTTDNYSPDDRTENEPVTITGPGFDDQVYTYGTQTITVPVTQDGESLNASISDGDGDESATIEVGATVTIDKVFTTDSQNVTVDYSVTNNDDESPFTLRVYRSNQGDYDPTNDHQVAVAEAPITGGDAGTGSHEIVIGPEGQSGFSIAQALAPDPTHEYVIATADDDGSLSSDDAYDPPQDEFRILLVADVTHGFTAPSGLNYVTQALTSNSLFPETPQAWVDTTASELAGDNYDAAFGFHWEQISNKTLPPGLSGGYFAELAGFQMAQQLIREIESPSPTDISASLLLTATTSTNAYSGAGETTWDQPGPNDVVDVQFIGHSRGSVVISQALMDLSDTNPDSGFDISGVPKSLSAGFDM